MQTTFEWLLRQDSSGRRAAVPDTVRLNPALVAIEQFARPIRDASGVLRHAALCRRPVRIAVLGDSFIEGDILTADLREKLQQAYGGAARLRPDGIAPDGLPAHDQNQSKGWTAYNIMQRKAAPQNLRGHFFVSGWVCQPSEGASTRWENTDYRQRLDSCTAARVFFISPGDSRIELTLNDSLRREFEVEGAAAVRKSRSRRPYPFAGIQGELRDGRVHRLRRCLRSRRRRGRQLLGAQQQRAGDVLDKPSVNAQINAHAGYDLVILQYGLNIMQTGCTTTPTTPDRSRKWSSTYSSASPRRPCWYWA